MLKAARLLLFIGLATLTACTPGAEKLPTPTASIAPQNTSTRTRLPLSTITASPTSTTTLTHTPNPSATPTITPRPSITPSITPTPVYEILRGQVNVEHVMCFYGPSKAYLYKYGLLGGSNLEIIGILPDTGYIQVRAIGGDNPCWMNLEWMDVKGDIASLQPIDPLSVKLPWSPYYGPLTWVNALRSASQVTISWSALSLRAGDDSEQEPYLVEVWVCQAGRLIFIPFGVYDTSLTVADEEGCPEASHGRVYGVEKHGYTLPIEISWPQN